MTERGKEPRGRRVAARSGRSTRGAATAAAVVLPTAFGLLAWVGAGAAPAGPQRGDPAVERVAVDVVSLVCHPADAQGGAVLVARPELGIDQPEDSVVRSGTPDAVGDSFDLPLGAVVRPERGTVPLVLRAEGPGAPAVFAEAVLGSPAGLAAASCVSPDTTWWFPGAGAGVGHRSTLVLTNVDEGPAVVDVRMYGVDGPVPADSLRGLTLAPGESRALELADIVPGRDLLTVEVSAVRGRVAAQMSEEGAGLEWPTASVAPSTVQRLPVVPSGPGGTVLTVTNPGTALTSVTIRVVTTTGAFVPVDSGEVLVEPGAVAALDISEAVGGVAAAVEVSADAAVVAGLRTTLSAPRDVATVPATGALTAPAAAGAGPGRTVLHMSAGERGVVAQVTAVAADGGVVAEQRLSVGGSSLVTWVVPSRSAYLVVAPTRGTPYAAVVRRGEEGGVAVAPLAPLPLERTVPEVRPQPAS